MIRKGKERARKKQEGNNYRVQNEKNIYTRVILIEPFDFSNETRRKSKGNILVLLLS